MTLCIHPPGYAPHSSLLLWTSPNWDLFAAATLGVVGTGRVSLALLFVESNYVLVYDPKSCHFISFRIKRLMTGKRSGAEGAAKEDSDRAMDFCQVHQYLTKRHDLNLGIEDDVMRCLKDFRPRRREKAQN